MIYCLFIVYIAGTGMLWRPFYLVYSFLDI